MLGGRANAHKPPAKTNVVLDIKGCVFIYILLYIICLYIYIIYIT